MFLRSISSTCCRRVWKAAPDRLRTKVFKQRSRPTDIGESGILRGAGRFGWLDLVFTAHGSWIRHWPMTISAREKKWLQHVISIELWWEWNFPGAWTKSRIVFELLDKLGLQASNDQVLADVLCKHKCPYASVMYHHHSGWNLCSTPVHGTFSQSCKHSILNR